MKRDRVRGTGPDRRKLKTFQVLGKASDETLEELRTILNWNPTLNDIGSERYAITNTIDYEKTHGVTKETYRQILLQHKDGSTRLDEATQGQVFKEDETLYTEWSKSYDLAHTKNELAKYFQKTYRFRLSEMEPNSSIAWHIDTNTSVMCRAQICLSSEKTPFLFKTSEGTEGIAPEYGDIYFINTGWPHSITTGSHSRQAAVFSFKFEDMIDGSVLFK